MNQYPIMFVLKGGKSSKFAIKSAKIPDGSPEYISNLNSPNNSYSFKYCLHDNWIPIYEERDTTKAIQINEMLTKHGDNLVTKIVKDVCNALDVGVKRDVALFYMKHQLSAIPKIHGDVFDSTVKDSISYYVDVYLVLNGFDELNFNDF